MRSFLQRVWKRFKVTTVVSLAAVWRRLLVRTTFIGITGSLGKTTTKECLAAILSARHRTARTYDTWNGLYGVARTILSARPWTRFAVVEIGTGTPGAVLPMARLLKPQVALILRVSRTHLATFRALEAIASEKSNLLRVLPECGTAVLNADDELVRAMAEVSPAPVVFFGSSPECEFHAGSAVSAWPGRLEFSLQADGKTFAVKTRLVGKHWAPSILAAITTAKVCGIPVSTAVEALKTVEPHMGRMQPAVLPSGAVILRDEVNGSIDSLRAAIEVLRDARCRRRMLLISDCSDCSRKPRMRMRDYARMAAECADGIIFVGDRSTQGAEYALKAGLPIENVHSFFALKDAAMFLREFLRSGDLVLMRGRATDHLTRIYYAQLGEVSCWKEYCSLRWICDICPKLGFVPGPVSPAHRGGQDTAEPAAGRVGTE